MAYHSSPNHYSNTVTDAIAAAAPAHPRATTATVSPPNRCTGGLHMRHTIFTRMLAGALPLILTSCGGGYGSGGGMGTTPCGGAYSACPLPTIALTAPAPGAIVSGTAVMLTATASASTMNGLTVTRVDFMIDGTIVGTAMTSPYTVSWNSTTVTMGSHSLTAKVTDSVNGTATTPAIMIN